MLCRGSDLLHNWREISLSNHIDECKQSEADEYPNNTNNLPEQTGGAFIPTPRKLKKQSSPENEYLIQFASSAWFGAKIYVAPRPQLTSQPNMVD
jgi:hypothetical protein